MEEHSVLLDSWSNPLIQTRGDQVRKTPLRGAVQHFYLWNTSNGSASRTTLHVHFSEEQYRAIEAPLLGERRKIVYRQRSLPDITA